MAAKYILAVLSVAFLVAAATRQVRDGSIGPAARTWFRIGLIFGAVSLWLWFGT
jgi:hypothetical protein